MRRFSALALLLLAAACAEAPTPTLPASATPAGTGDRVLRVGTDMTSFFLDPQPNRPAAAARAIAELEWLADSLPRNPRWQNASSVGLNGLQQARWEARTALGIPRSATGQSVIVGLAAAAQAIEANDQAALARALPRRVFPLGPQETVRRLSIPPAVRDAVPAFQSIASDPNQGAVH